MARGGWWGFRMELTLTEMIALLLGAIGSAFAIFLLGVWVGKGWEARQLQAEQQIVRVPIEPDVATRPEREEREMEFYEALIHPEPSPTPESAGAPPPPSVAAPPPSPKPTPKPTPPKPPAPKASVPSPKVDRAPEEGKWSVQVLASRDPRVARRLAQSLAREGYRARVVELRGAGGTRYRVRVGPFPSFERATEAAGRLRRRPGITEAFVASD